MSGQDTRVVRRAVERGLHLTDLSNATGCSARAMYRYLTRQITVPPLALPALCDLLECDEEDLVGDDGYFALELSDSIPEAP